MRGLMAALLVAMTASAMAQDAAVTTEIATDGSRTLLHELSVPAPQDQVWQAVATEQGWRTWAVPLIRKVRGSQRFETNYDPSAAPSALTGIVQQWIIRKSPHTATFRTIRTPAGFPHAAAYLNVVSTFTLTPDGPKATRVRLTGAGYPAGAEGDALIAFFRAGNSMALRQLHKRFASGPIAWSANPDRDKGGGHAGD